MLLIPGLYGIDTKNSLIMQITVSYMHAQSPQLHKGLLFHAGTGSFTTDESNWMSNILLVTKLYVSRFSVSILNITSSYSVFYFNFQAEYTNLL